MLVVILCTVRQSFPCQLLFQCWDPYDILHWTFHDDTFCLNKHSGKLWGHTKFWYPSRDWLGWRCSSEDPYTPGLWQVCYSSGQARGTLWDPSHTSLEEQLDSCPVDQPTLGHKYYIVPQQALISENRNRLDVPHHPDLSVAVPRQCCLHLHRNKDQWLRRWHRSKPTPGCLSAPP
jgi:hypothetical protein